MNSPLVQNATTAKQEVGRLRRWPARCVVLLSSVLLSGCAATLGSAAIVQSTAIVATIVGDAAYSAAFRIRIEDISKLPVDEAQQVRDVKLINLPTDSIYLSNGKIVSLACKLSIAPLIPVWTWRPILSETNGRTPEEAAMMQFRLTAVRAGGYAIISPSCVHSDSIDWLNNCFETWICTGEAIRLAEK